MPILTTIVEQS